ncbi:MAG: hypothetical protein R6W06_00230 [Prochlorococcaceae cyanobacterium]
MLAIRSFPLAAVALLALAPLALAPRALAQEVPSLLPSDSRPAGLVLLQQRPVLGGTQTIGVYGAEADRLEPGLWRIKVWDELPDDVKVRSETIRCGTAAPMRVTSDGRVLIVRELNPGGAINPSNRLDHLIWWATCFPQRAGQDPAGLGAEARRLGYSGHLVEQEQRLPLAGRR